MSAVDLTRAAMVGWTERATGRAPAGGPVLTQLLRTHADTLTGHVVVLGPHTPEVLDHLHGRAEKVTVVVRGTVDAEDLAADGRFAVRCGDVTTLAGLEDASAVVALDGFERMLSVESGRVRWAERLELVRAAMSPEAVLILAVNNPLSLTVLCGDDRRSQDHDDAWDPLVHGTDPSEPTDPRAPFNTADGAPAVWSAFATTQETGVLIPYGITASRPDLATLAVAAYGPASKKQAALRRAALADRFDQPADSWIVWLGVPATSATPITASGVVTTLVPQGQLLSERLLDAVADHDAAAVRELLGRVIDLTATLPAEEAARIGLDSVVVGDGGDLALLPNDGPSEATAASRDPVVRVAATLAVRIRAARLRHPWPRGHSTAELATLILAEAGVAIAPDPLDDLTVADDQPGATAVVGADDEWRLLRARERGLRYELELADTRSHRTTAELDRARTAATERQQQVRRLRRRVKRLTERLEALERSRSYRLARALTWPTRMTQGRQSEGKS